MLRTARACMPVTIEPVDLVGGELGLLQRGVPRLLDERRVLHLAEALFPRARAAGAGCPPALDELLGGGRAAEVLGDHRAVGVGADEDRGRAVAALRLVGARGQAVAHVGRDHEHRARCRRARCAARRHPIAARRRSRARSPAMSSRSAAWIADALFLSRYAGLAVENHNALDRRALGRRLAGEAGGLDGQRGGVLVVRRDRPGALAPTRAEGLGDLTAVESAERDVAGGADDSLHAGESRRAPERAVPSGSRPYSVARATRRHGQRRRAARTASRSTACACSRPSRCRRCRSRPSCWPGSAPTW